jgi:hypothetical protein
MAGTKIDIGKMVTDLFNTGVNYLNNRIGSGASPLNQTTPGQVKVGNVGGIFGINLNTTTLLLIGGGLVAVVLLVKKFK